MKPDEYEEWMQQGLDIMTTPPLPQEIKSAEEHIAELNKFPNVALATINQRDLAIWNAAIKKAAEATTNAGVHSGFINVGAYQEADRSAILNLERRVEELKKSQVFLAKKQVQLRAENAELLKDRGRLVATLQSCHAWIAGEFGCDNWRVETIRQAIDAAKKES